MDKKQYEYARDEIGGSWDINVALLYQYMQYVLAKMANEGDDDVDDTGTARDYIINNNSAMPLLKCLMCDIKPYADYASLIPYQEMYETLLISSQKFRTRWVQRKDTNIDSLLKEFEMVALANNHPIVTGAEEDESHADTYSRSGFGLVILVMRDTIENIITQQEQFAIDTLEAIRDHLQISDYGIYSNTITYRLGQIIAALKDHNQNALLYYLAALRMELRGGPKYSEEDMKILQQEAWEKGWKAKEEHNRRLETRTASRLGRLDID